MVSERLESLMYLLQTSPVVYISGQAGAGKTHLLKEFIKHCEKTKVGVAVTASTGIASTHIGGTTLHSFLGISPFSNVRALLNYCKDYCIIMKSKLEDIDYLVIDEVSMLDSEMFETIHDILTSIKDPTQHFGGIKLIISGDFLQLPPVSEEGEPPKKYFFESRLWELVKTLHLSTIHRQKKETFSTFLNKIRVGEYNNYMFSKLFDGNFTTLFATNDEADVVNMRCLNELNQPLVKLRRRNYGDLAECANISNKIIGPSEVFICLGARVMITANDHDLGLVNGDVGEVEDFELTKSGVYSVMVLVHRKKRSYWIEPKDKKTVRRGELVAQVSYTPLILAYALTIHKSQGMSLDGLNVDCSRIFEKGQLYVALSRAVDPKKLRVVNLNESKLKTCGTALKFYDELKPDVVVK